MPPSTLSKAVLPDHIAHLISQIDAMQKVVDAEGVAKAKIEFSEKYISLNQQIDFLESQKAMMLEGLPDSSGKLGQLKQTLMAVMEREGRERVGHLEAKFREERGVNTTKLLHALQGDIDRFVKLANVTQIALKAHAKEEGGERETLLLDCIEVTSRKMVDLVPSKAER